MKKKRVPFTGIPKLSDPRWLILLYLGAFTIYALLSPGYARTPVQFLAAFGTAAGLDLALAYLYQGILLFPLSATITSMGVLLLCDSPTVWIFALTSAVAVLSKHFR